MLGMFVAAVLAALLRLSAGQDAICNFTYDVQPEQTYYINDSSLANKTKQCNWAGYCPWGYRCRLDCELNLPDSPGCSADRLLISRSEGSKDYAHKYCGPGSTKIVSFGQHINADLTLSSNTEGSNFSCQLTSRKVQCRCGYKKLSRLVDGEATGVNEFPMMAYVKYFGRIRQGAAIIDKRYVLTVAHAVQNGTENLFVAVGKHNITFGMETTATQVINVDHILIHPLFTNTSRDYDIAILRVKADFEFSDSVGAVCLPFKFTRTSFTGAEVTLLGWGTLSENGTIPTVLQTVNVTVISESECRVKYPELTTRQICTDTPGKDACQGDSGGPVLYTEPSTGLIFLIGIISHWRSCAVDPAVNTRVTEYLNWIGKNTPGAKYCYN